mmetsp:Transcript_29549/g.95277  ORF Transcript_29549/g.95277 Transcript_29549/m.95277 type:complete len:211 (-) Transcript_29549:412-1044(-)
MAATSSVARPSEPRSWSCLTATLACCQVAARTTPEAPEPRCCGFSPKSTSAHSARRSFRRGVCCRGAVSSSLSRKCFSPLEEKRRGFPLRAIQARFGKVRTEGAMEARSLFARRRSSSLPRPSAGSKVVNLLLASMSLRTFFKADQSAMRSMKLSVRIKCWTFGGKFPSISFRPLLRRPRRVTVVNSRRTLGRRVMRREPRTNKTSSFVS